MKEFRARFDFKIPDGIEVSESEVEDWLSYQIGATCELSGNNPLVDYDLEADWRTVFIDPR